jgi:hypothetical protein
MSDGPDLSLTQDFTGQGQHRIRYSDLTSLRGREKIPWAIQTAPCYGCESCEFEIAGNPVSTLQCEVAWKKTQGRQPCWDAVWTRQAPPQVIKRGNLGAEDYRKKFLPVNRISAHQEAQQKWMGPHGEAPNAPEGWRGSGVTLWCGAYSGNAPDKGPARPRPQRGPAATMAALRTAPRRRLSAPAFSPFPCAPPPRPVTRFRLTKLLELRHVTKNPPVSEDLARPGADERVDAFRPEGN